MIRPLAFVIAALAGSLAAPLVQAQAQTYPTKPIRLVIAAAPGGGTDAIGRVMAEALSASLKQQVVPENRAGAAGQIGADLVVKSASDGYTLLVTQNAHTTNPALFRKLPYDTLKDFTPIAGLATSPLVLVAGAHTNVKTVQELLELGRRDPKAMTFGSAESSARLASEQLSDATGLKFVNVMYKGTGPVMTDVAGGHVNFSITTMASALPFRSNGRVNFLAVLSPERSRFMPDVPTAAEQGLPNIVVRGWWAVFGPANLPAAVVEPLSAAVRAALGTPAVRARLENLYQEVWATTPQELDAFVRRDVPVQQRLAKMAGIEPE